MSKPLESPALRQSAFWGIAGVSLGLYWLFYYTLQRDETANLITLYLGLFTLHTLAYILVKDAREIRFFIVISLVARLLAFGGMPVLSDDIYRFLWDGYLLNAGENPFVTIPADYMAQGVKIPGLSQELYSLLNSPEYHSVYPPFCQAIYWLAVKISPSSWLGATIVIRGIIFLAEVGSIYLIYKLLAKYKKPQGPVLLYALNPLVIIEFTGNLHFEALVIFFLLLSVYLLKTRHRILSSFAFGFAVITKLLPLMFLPLLFKRLKLDRAILYYSIVGAVVVVSFLPFLSRDFLLGLSDSLSLYFASFEFNASIYYLVREIGYSAVGYNIIQSAGTVLAVVSLTSILAFVVLEKPQRSSLPKAFLWVLTLYLLFTTTVHPWYVLPLVAYSSLTRLRFPIVWSLVVIVSYTGYTETGYKENLWLVALEYLIVAGFVFFELLNTPTKRKKSTKDTLVVSDSVTLRS
ncbi:MAG: glycosyltransferase 87 family protein [Bacteroidota bacterium]